VVLEEVWEWGDVGVLFFFLLWGVGGGGGGGGGGGERGDGGIINVLVHVWTS